MRTRRPLIRASRSAQQRRKRAAYGTDASIKRQFAKRQHRTAAVGHQAGLAIAADLAGDQAELQLAAVFVVLALDRLDGDHDTRQAAVGIHRLEARRQPGVGP